MKFMKTKLMLAMAAITTGLFGCSEGVNQDDAANRLASETLNKETQELKQLEAKLKEQDPTVKEVFKSVGDDGKEVINIVREDDNTGDMLVAGMLGMTAGMLMSNMMNNRPIVYNNTSVMSKTSYKSYKRTSVSNYTKNVRKKAKNKVASNPSKYNVSTRGRAFSGKSSRSGSYSRGG